MDFQSVVCILGNELYGIDINIVQGIEKEQEIVRVPNTSDYIKGIMNLRGDIIPIFDLRRKFGMPELKGDAQYVVVSVDDMLLAIEVDGVGEIIHADETMLYDAPRICISGNTKYVDKVINSDGKLIIVLDVSKLLSEAEKSGIGNLITV